MNSERVFLTVKKATALLPKRQKLHTFTILGNILLGCDISRETILEYFKKYGAELAGPNMTRMDHGLAVLRPGEKGWLFIETKPVKTKEKQNEKTKK